jgi:long-chain acyl-CoA synthetase
MLGERVEVALQRASTRFSSKLALVCGDHRLTYAELARRVDELASGLAARGIRRGDRVLLWLPNGVELAVAIYAVLRCGAVFVVMDASSKADRIAYVLADCQARAILLPAAKLSPAVVAQFSSQVEGSLLIVAVAASKSCAGIDGVSVIALQDLLGVGREVPAMPGIDRDLACLVYTSGSTGAPKGVMSAHHNVQFAVRSISAALGTTGDDVVISPLPLSFDYGLYQLLMTVATGATLVLASFTYPAAFLELVRNERATVLPGVPTMWAMMLGMDLTSFDLQSLRVLTNTGAALPVAHIEALRTALPQVRIYAMYGLTETKRTLILPPEQLLARPGSVGIAIPGTECWVQGPDGMEVGVGEVGELVVRGGHVMLGYWNAPEASAQRFPPGPLPGERLCRTGDLFRRDADGYFYFVSRTDDVLKIRGQKVAPQEVEAVLHAMPGVREAAVVAVVNARQEQVLCAHVVRASQDLTELAVKRHCRQHLTDFQVPDAVVFVDALPQTGNGKVARRELQS